jgi:hypothetical protein
MGGSCKVVKCVCVGGGGAVVFGGARCVLGGPGGVKVTKGF